jgi:hypothetical protein
MPTSEGLRRIADILEQYPDVSVTVTVDSPATDTETQTRRRLTAVLACGDPTITISTAMVTVIVDGPVPVNMFLYGKDRALATTVAEVVDTQTVPVSAAELRARLVDA